MKLVKEVSNTIYNNFGFNIIYNNYTLNLFSDASMRDTSETTLAGCYGSVAISGDNIIDELIRINSCTTVPAAEIRGIRCSLLLALKYRYNYKVINIFSDSQIAVFGLRDYIYGWNYNPDTKRFYTKGSKFNKAAEAKNQELYIECLSLLLELAKTNIVNIYHQKGHIDNDRALSNAISVFKKSNNINGKIDYNFIRYISIYNNYIDNKTRSILLRTNVREIQYKDAILFDLPDFVKLK